MTPRNDDDRRTRKIAFAGVPALDDALARAAGVSVDRVMHAFDQRRDVRFVDGGPPVWSVGAVVCSTAKPEMLFCTYGLSRALSPESPFDHELSIRIAHDTRDQAPAWPTMLLRHLARYELASERAHGEGETLAFNEPITRAAVADEDAADQPDTAMCALAFLRDPELGVVKTPAGAINVHRAFGILPDELTLTGRGPSGAVALAIAKQLSSLITDLSRASLAAEPNVVAAARG